MPIYEYKCTICDQRFEVEQSIKDDTLTSLPGDDHEHAVRKVFHPVGIAFKGEGFYKNDSRSSSSSRSSGSSESNAATKTSSSSSSSEGSGSGGSSSTETAGTSS